MDPEPGGQLQKGRDLLSSPEWLLEEAPGLMPHIPGGQGRDEARRGLVTRQIGQGNRGEGRAAVGQGERCWIVQNVGQALPLIRGGSELSWQ